MNDQIEKLILNKRLFDALTLINNELKKGVDLSDETQRDLFDHLYGLKDKIGYELEETVRSALTINNSQSAGISIGNTYENLFGLIKNFYDKLKSAPPSISIGEAFSQIRIQKSLGAFPNEFEAYLVIHDEKEMINELTSEYNLQNVVVIKDISSGFDFRTLKTNSGKTCFFVNIKSDAEDYDTTHFINELSALIALFYNNEYERIGVMILSGNEFVNIDFLIIHFNFILLTFLLKIIQNARKSIQPIFSILCHQDSTKELYEKTAIQLIKSKSPSPAIHQSNKDSILNELKSRCMTKDSAYIKQLKTIVHIINENGVNILIQGESGVGKSFLAKIIHETSPRNKFPFEDQNCGSLQDDKLIQNLWGWKKGSFTDAKNDYIGKVKRAEGGTLFLDEIDRTSAGVRNGLLTFIEKKMYEILGGDKTETADVRIIFGTNKDLKSLVKKGLFEEDFYYRISERIIRIPPLRERVEDIDLIITTTLNMLCEKKGSIISIEKKERDYLKEYSWPGNVRELMRYINKVYLDAFSEGHKEITLEQLQSTPFDGISVAREEDYEVLVENLKRFLSEWDSTKGPFLDEVIGPILAKLYMDECFKNVSRTKKWEQAMNILGISGNKYYESTLAKSYDKFEEVKSKLGF